jgi:manganese/iron transport system ATP-binding protein
MTMSSDAPVLRLQGVDAGYGGRLALHAVSFAVAAGARVGIIGPNGGGKTTLFRVALGILSPWRGSVELFGIPARQLDHRANPLAYVPQVRHLNLTFPASARDVVAMGRVGRLGLLRRTGPQDRALIDQALEQVHLAHKADRPFSALSGGEQQRLLLARALVTEARLFFLDEPVTGLDVATKEQFDQILAALAVRGCALVVSTHDLSAENLARFDWLICINQSVVAQGPPAEVTSLDVWRQLFSGRNRAGAGV